MKRRFCYLISIFIALSCFSQDLYYPQYRFFGVEEEETEAHLILIDFRVGYNDPIHRYENSFSVRRVNKIPTLKENLGFGKGFALDRFFYHYDENADEPWLLIGFRNREYNKTHMFEIKGYDEKDDLIPVREFFAYDVGGYLRAKAEGKYSTYFIGTREFIQNYKNTNTVGGMLINKINLNTYKNYVLVPEGGKKRVEVITDLLVKDMRKNPLIKECKTLQEFFK